MSQLARDIVSDEGNANPNLNRLVEEILDQAKADAEQILDQGAKKASEIRAQGEEKAQNLAAEKKAHYQQVALETKARIIGSANREAIRERLAAMGEVISELKGYVATRLAEVNPDAYVKLLKTLLIQATQTGKEEVSWARNDQALAGNILRDVNLWLSREGQQGELTMGSPLPEEYSGGFILRGKDYEVNATTQVLTEIFFDEYEPEIAKILFGKL